MEDTIPQDYYVYTYRYPESMGGAIFYVGKGKRDRIDAHEVEARKGFRSVKCDVIREIWTAGEEVVKEKVAFFEKEEDAYVYEWGLMNMTTYAECLVNICRGKGRSTRVVVDIQEESEGAQCDYCGSMIPGHKVNRKYKRHYCNKDYQYAYLTKLSGMPYLAPQARGI